MRYRTGRTISIRSTIFPEKGLHIACSFWLLLGAALVVSPLQVTAAVLLAASMHEAGHLLLLCAFGAPIRGLRLSAMGAELYASTVRLSYQREFLVTLAGPAVNLLFGPLCALLAVRFAWEWGYLLAGAHLLLGVYNLLPIPPLDGWRFLRLLAVWRRGPGCGETLSDLIGLGTALALTALSLWQTLSRGGVFFLLASAGLLLGAVRSCLFDRSAPHKHAG